MQSKDNDFVYVVHYEPAWRAVPALYAMADLEPFGLEGQREQLWLREVEEEVYELRCIPFMVEGLALGDHVTAGEDSCIDAVVAKSGRHVLRLFWPSEDGQDSRLAMRATLGEHGFLSEWHGDRFVSVDVVPDADLKVLFAPVHAHIQEGLVRYDWSDTLPFLPPGRP